MKWVRTASLKTYNVVGAFEKFDTLYWKKSTYKIKEGDIVYIYVGKPYSKIMYKTICIDAEAKSTDAEASKDIEFWEKGKMPTHTYDCMILKFVSKTDSTETDLETLKSMGYVKNRIQGAISSSKSPALFDYLERFFKKE